MSIAETIAIVSSVCRLNPCVKPMDKNRKRQGRRPDRYVSACSLVVLALPNELRNDAVSALGYSRLWEARRFLETSGKDRFRKSEEFRRIAKMVFDRIY